MSSEQALFVVTLVLYLASSVAYHIHLFAGSEKARRWALVACAVGLAAHLGAIGAWCTSHNWSILRDPAMPYSLVAFFLAVAQALTSLRPGWAALGSLAMPLAFLAQFYAGLRTPGSAIQAPPGGALLSPHVLAPLLGSAAFTVAFCLAVLYLVQSRLLKRKELRGPIRRLPPLESVANGAHWMAIIGFSLLTLGIVTGSMAAPERWGPGWYLDAHTVTSVLAWAIYAAYLGVSLFGGWRGRRTTYFLIAGFVAIVVALVTSVGRPRGGHTPATGVSGPAALRVPTEDGGPMTEGALVRARFGLPSSVLGRAPCENPRATPHQARKST